MTTTVAFFAFRFLLFLVAMPLLHRIRQVGQTSALWPNSVQSQDSGVVGDMKTILALELSMEEAIVLTGRLANRFQGKKFQAEEVTCQNFRVKGPTNPEVTAYVASYLDSLADTGVN
jgi:hypothetical protein